MASPKYQVCGYIRLQTEVGQYSFVDQGAMVEEVLSERISRLFTEMQFRVEKETKEKLGIPVNLKIMGDRGNYKLIIHFPDKRQKDLPMSRQEGDKVYGLDELFESIKKVAGQFHPDVQEVIHLRITPEKETFPVTKTG